MEDMVRIVGLNDVLANPSIVNWDEILCVTHNGPFHADEVWATAWLIEEKGLGCAVIRTRDERVLDIKRESPQDETYVYDVLEGPLDHHGKICQARNGDVWPGIPHSAMSLVANKTLGGKLEEHPVLHRVFSAIAATDNGRDMPPVLAQWDKAGFVHDFNPDWDEPNQDFDSGFCRAVEAVRPIIRELHREDAAAVRSVERLKQIKPQIITELPSGGMPFWGMVFAPTVAQFIIFPVGGEWRLQCVPPSEVEAKKQKTPHPENWRGLRASDLTAVSGISGAIFCHLTGFISGWDTKEHAIQAAKMILEMN